MIFARTHIKTLLTIVSVCGVAAVLLAASFRIPPVHATSANNVAGFAWSETAGWVSFNNTSDGTGQPYGVSIDVSNRVAGGTGAFSGQAWSENLGWISFDRATTGNPPLAPLNGGNGPTAQVDWSTGKVTGWARATAGCQATSGTPATTCSGSGAGAATGGWDGWIKLAKDPSDAGPAYGVTINTTTGAFSGYAWGSDVVGWVDMAPAAGNLGATFFGGLPNLTADPATPLTGVVGVPINFSSIIRNTGTGATNTGFSVLFQRAGQANGGGTIVDISPVTTVGVIPASGNIVAVSSPITIATAQTVSVRVCADMTAYGVGGVIAESSEGDNCTGWTNVVIKGTCALPWGGNIVDGGQVTAYQYPRYDTSPPSSNACPSEVRTCSTPNLSGSFTNQSCVMPAPTVSLSAIPTRVKLPTTNWPTIIWAVTDITSCSITKNGVVWRSGITASGSAVDNAITTQSTYKINCTGIDTSINNIASVLVNISPIYGDF